MNRRVTKLFTTKPSSVNEDEKSVSLVISTNQADRYGEIVDQKSWDFKSFLKNPVVFWGHTSYEPEYVLGTASSLKIAEDGSETTATLKFDTDINPKADLVFNQIRRGTLRTVSVGFMNHTYNTEDDTPVLKDNELLEISVVPIPANPGAVALGLKAGELNHKDAKWLMDGMRKEADLMEEQIEATKSTNEENSMTPEQATAMLEGMSKLTEKVDALATENQTLREQIATEQKTREDEAAAKAAADKKAADDEAARIAAEEAKKAEDLAKGGDNDQPGAKDDDFDEDADLTPALQAEIDAALAEEANEE